MQLAIVSLVTLALTMSLRARQHASEHDRLVTLAITLMASATFLHQAPWQWTRTLAADLLQKILVVGCCGVIVLLVTRFSERGNGLRERAVKHTSIALIFSMVIMVIVSKHPLTHVRPSQDMVAGQHPWLHAYDITYELMVLVVAGINMAVALTMLTRRAPWTSHLAVTFWLAMTLCATLNAGLGLGVLSGFDLPGYPQSHEQTLLALLAFLVVMLMQVHLLGRLTQIWSRRVIAMGEQVVDPVWKMVTTLHPDVVLPVPQTSPAERLLRRTLETQDALSLITRDDDPVLQEVRSRHHTPAAATAATLMHLLGPNALPKRPRLRALTTLVLARLAPVPGGSQALHQSLIELAVLHNACARQRQT